MKLGYQTDHDGNVTIGIKEGFIDVRDDLALVICGFLYIEGE